MKRQQINVRLNSTTMQQIEILSEITGGSQSQVVVQAIERMYQQEKPNMKRRMVAMLEDLTPQEVDQVADGTIEVSPMGDSYYFLTPRQRQDYEDAKANGYAVDRSSSNWNTGNCYWLFCRSTRRPFVAIRERETYATVEIDMTTTTADQQTHKVLSKDAMEQIRDVLRSKNGRGWYRFSPLFAEAITIPCQDAGQIAEQIFALACNDLDFTDDYLVNSEIEGEVV